MIKTPKLRFKEFSGDWEVKKLGDECRFFSGGTPLTTNRSYYDGNIPFIRSAEISGDTTELTISESGLNNSSAKMVQKGDLLYALYGATSGEVSISKIDGAINQAILCIKSDTLNLSFLEKILRKNKQNIINTYLQGGQGNLSSNIVKGLKYSIPSIEEQEKIASFFSLIDDKISLQGEKVEALRDYKKGMMQKIFGRELRFKDDEGRDYPEWEEKKLEDIFNFQYGQFNNNPDNGGKYPIYGANGIIGGYHEYNAEKSVIIGHMGAYAGKVLWEEKKHFVTYNGTIGKPKDNQTLIPKFGYYMLLNKNIQKICAGSGQPFLSYNDLNKIKVICPKDILEQEKIANFLTDLDHKIEKEQEKLDSLNEYKKGLLQQMFI